MKWGAALLFASACSSSPSKGINFDAGPCALLGHGCLDLACCDGVCLAGVCVCTANGAACGKGSECCSGVCTGGLCAACNIVGAGCGVGANCCSGRCESSACACSPADGGCVSNGDCCAGVFCEQGRCVSCLAHDDQCNGLNCPVGQCNSVVPDGGVSLTCTGSRAPPPSPGGGTLVDGRYVLTSCYAYSSTGASATRPPTALELCVGGGLIQRATGGLTPMAETLAFTNAGTSLSLTRSCPACTNGCTSPVGYTATAGMLELTSATTAGGVTTTVLETYALQ